MTATAMPVSTCGVCSAHSHCAIMLGLMLGLDRWVSQLGYIPEGHGGTIGLALRHSHMALSDCDRAMHQPYRPEALQCLQECKVGLNRFRHLAGRKCGPGDVRSLLDTASFCHTHAWDAAGLVYGR